MPTPVVDAFQTENGYPVDAEILTQLALEVGQGKEGFIYDKVFSPVDTGGLCEVMGFDFKKTFDLLGAETHESVLDLQKPQDNEMTCDSEAKEIPKPKFSRRHFKSAWYANKVNLNECCANICGMSSQDYDNLIESVKVKTLIDNFHIKREIAGIDLLVGKVGPDWNAGWTDALGADLAVCSTTTDVEGVAFDMGAGKICDQAYDWQTLFGNLMGESKYCSGQRNSLLISRKALLALMRNDTLKPSGCIITPQTTIDGLKAELGVSEVIIADAFTNTAGIGLPASFANMWDSSFMLFFQKNTGLQSLEDPRTKQNFGVDIKQFQEHFRTFTKVESGMSGVDYLQYNYAYKPEIHNLKAGTLFYNI